MPKILSQDAHPRKQVTLRGQRMAVPPLGDPYYGSFTVGTWKKKVRNRRNGLLHQTGRSRSVCQHNTDWGNQIHLETHRLQVCTHAEDHSWQRHVVHRKGGAKIMFRSRNSIKLLVKNLPTGKRASQIFQQNHLRMHQEEIGRLKRKIGRWIAECPLGLPHNKRTATGETPFSIVYGTEAVIPTELSFPTARTALTDFGSNEDAIMLDLNLIEERTEIAAIKMLAYQQKVAELYNKQIWEKSFKVGDPVLREVTLNTKIPTDSKLRLT